MRKVQKYNDTGWIEPKLLNGWDNYSDEYQNAAYRVINGIVYIKGLIKNGNDLAIFKLPNIYKPLRTHMLITNNSPESHIRIDITKDGAVSISGSFSATWVSLSGISFPLDY